jgi:hypothetical protein
MNELVGRVEKGGDMSIAHVDPSLSLASDEMRPTGIQMSLVGSASVVTPSISTKKNLWGLEGQCTAESRRRRTMRKRSDGFNMHEKTRRGEIPSSHFCYIP